MEERPTSFGKALLGLLPPIHKWDFLAIAILLGLLTTSFFLYSAYCYPALNSDMAMHALMARKFDFHHSLYYWGQTRLGSLQPLFSFVFWKMGVDALLASSLVQYGMAAFALIAVASIAQNWWVAALYGTLLLFPMPNHIYVLAIGHPVLPHLMLTSVGLAIALRIYRTNWSMHFTVMYWLVGLVAVWVSDLALITVPGILGLLLILNWRSDRFQLTKSPVFWSLIIGTPLLLVFVKLLKRSRLDWSGYTGKRFASFSDIVAGVHDQMASVWEAFGMGSVTQVYVVLSVVIVVSVGVLLIYHLVKSTVGSRVPFSAVILMAFSLTIYAAVMLSEWAAMSHYDSRYLVLPFHLLLLGSVIFIGQVSMNHMRVVFTLMFVSMGITGAMTFPEHISPEGRFQLDGQSREKLRQLHSAAIISDYWFSYAMAVYHAEEITPLAFDSQFVRNGHQVNEAFEKENIFLCLPNGSVFPDTVAQFNRTLTKSGDDPMLIGNGQLQRYSVLR